MKRPASALIVIALSLILAGMHSAVYAEQLSVDSWQSKRLFQPTQAQLASEAKGRVMIYDGMTDRVVNKALREQFNRVDHMMFTRVVVTDADGAASRDASSGAVVYEDDGCD